MNFYLPHLQKCYYLINKEKSIFHYRFNHYQNLNLHSNNYIYIIFYLNYLAQFPICFHLLIIFNYSYKWIEQPLYIQICHEFIFVMLDNRFNGLKLDFKKMYLIFISRMIDIEIFIYHLLFILIKLLIQFLFDFTMIHY